MSWLHSPFKKEVHKLHIGGGTLSFQAVFMLQSTFNCVTSFLSWAQFRSRDALLLGLVLHSLQSCTVFGEGLCTLYSAELIPQLRERKRLRYMVLGSQSIGTRPQWLWWRLWSRYYKCKFSSQDLTFIYIFVCPQVCLIFLTFLHSKVRKNDKIASRQNSVNHRHRVDFYTGCKITHVIHNGCPR